MNTLLAPSTTKATGVDDWLVEWNQRCARVYRLGMILLGNEAEVIEVMEQIASYEGAKRQPTQASIRSTQMQLTC